LDYFNLGIIKEKTIMKITWMGLLYWSPRVLSVLFAGFISLFALDVFSEGYGFGETLLALAIHLIPTAVMIVFIVLAWRWAWIGALAFLGMGLWYLLMTGGKEHWMTYVLISGPLFLMAILFLFNWMWRSKLNRTQQAEAD
jgi:hypothetical protein